MRIIAVGMLYFLIVFGVGFLLGPMRVYLLEPRLGETMATLCEAPFLLIVIVLAARWLPKRFNMRMSAASLAAVGLGGLFLQQLADVVVGTLLRGITLAQQLSHLATPAGLIYMGLLLAYVAMPVLVNWPRLSGANARSTEHNP